MLILCQSLEEIILLATKIFIYFSNYTNTWPRKTILRLTPSFKNLIYVDMGQGESTTHIVRFKLTFAKIIHFIICDRNEECLFLQVKQTDGAILLILIRESLTILTSRIFGILRKNLLTRTTAGPFDVEGNVGW